MLLKARDLVRLVRLALPRYLLYAVRTYLRLRLRVPSPRAHQYHLLHLVGICAMAIPCSRTTRYALILRPSDMEKTKTAPYLSRTHPSPTCPFMQNKRFNHHTYYA